MTLDILELTWNKTGIPTSGPAIVACIERAGYVNTGRKDSFFK